MQVLAQGSRASWVGNSRPELHDKHREGFLPLERLGQPDDIANTVAFLAWPDGAWINGQVLRANGGII